MEGVRTQQAHSMDHRQREAREAGGNNAENRCGIGLYQMRTLCKRRLGTEAFADDGTAVWRLAFLGRHPACHAGSGEADHFSRHVPVGFPSASQVLPAPVGYSTGDVMMDAPRRGNRSSVHLAGVMMPAPAGSFAAVFSRVRETRPSRSRKARHLQSRRRCAVIE